MHRNRTVRCKASLLLYSAQALLSVQWPTQGKENKCEFLCKFCSCNSEVFRERLTRGIFIRTGREGAVWKEVFGNAEVMIQGGDWGQTTSFSTTYYSFYNCHPHIFLYQTIAYSIYFYSYVIVQFYCLLLGVVFVLICFYLQNVSWQEFHHPREYTRLIICFVVR